ncbi:MAG: ABC transporter substrate-binding protein, partial [Anaerolineae bacterium]|nr:ABC transporter substrate-binding protein [Anaerolineae bacterium]
GPLPPGSWGYDISLRQYDYDPVKAETLLAEASYPDGFETTLFLSTISRPYNPNPLGLAEAVQRDLAEVGIEVEIKTFDVRSEYSAAIDADEAPMFLLGWSGGPPDPYFYLNPLLSTPMVAANLNDANYSNPQVDELLTEAAETMDRSARRQLYVEAQRIIIDDAPWAFMNHMMYMVATSSRVQGFKLHATSLLKLGGVYLTE